MVTLPGSAAQAQPLHGERVSGVTGFVVNLALTAHR
jgi:hypothetical protein